MTKMSLLREGHYSTPWIADFYEQADLWWGVHTGDAQEDSHRADLIQRHCGGPPKRILELGAGNGRSAAVAANRGFHVTAIELGQKRSDHAKSLAQSVTCGFLTVVQGSSYAEKLPCDFDAICYWDGFGLGSDADHRRLLRRIAQEWMSPEGCALIDIANPYWAIRNDGKEQRLAPVSGVRDSVELNRKWHFDACSCRWIDEWEPVRYPDEALSQTVRCYSIPDLRLLLEGTGLRLALVEVGTERLDVDSDQIAIESDMKGSYSYLAKLVLESATRESARRCPVPGQVRRSCSDEGWL